VKVLERKFLFVTGKGGVGKTTVSLAIAESLSRAGRRTLLATPDPAPYGRLLPGARFTTTPSEVATRLWVVHLDAAEALQEYGRLLISARLARHALFGNRYVQSFMAAVPGLYPWAELGKAWYHTTEMAGGERRFDTVVFDGPATGHGLDMLRTPRALLRIAPAGVMRRDAEIAWRMFQDPAQSGVVLVSLPEELPTHETEELYSALQEDLGFPVAGLFVNRVKVPVFPPVERAWLASLPVAAQLGPGPAQQPGQGAATPPGPGEALLDCALARAYSEQVQADALEALRRLPPRVATLTELPAALAGSPRGVSTLATELSQQLEPSRVQ
jgi:anion-transporting  ArsA/GET3 family ATPase